jgi:hypothetical protein
MTKLLQIPGTSSALKFKTTSVLLIRSLDSIGSSRNIKNLKSLDAISDRLVVFVINSRARQIGIRGM